MRLEHPTAPGEWRHDAACRGHVMFYSCVQAHHNRLSYADRVMERAALAICETCPVIASCRTWALQSVDPAVDHVAGGLTPRQRWAIRKGTPL